ncbi:MAG: hypothetical protein MHM6MM_006202 [Cercozoa sp. M6MM]
MARPKSTRKETAGTTVTVTKIDKKNGEDITGIARLILTLQSMPATYALVSVCSAVVTLGVFLSAKPDALGIGGRFTVTRTQLHLVQFAQLGSAVWTAVDLILFAARPQCYSTRRSNLYAQRATALRAAVLLTSLFSCVHAVHCLSALDVENAMCRMRHQQEEIQWQHLYRHHAQAGDLASMPPFPVMNCVNSQPVIINMFLVSGSLDVLAAFYAIHLLRKHYAVGSSSCP